MRGEFLGGTFSGNFKGLYKDYRAHPSTFKGGTVSLYEEGVLNISKSDETTLNSASIKKFISLLEIQVGHYVNITGEDDKVYTFKMEKSLDDRSSDIIVEQISRLGSQRIVIKWSDIRTSDDPYIFDRLSRTTIGRDLEIPSGNAAASAATRSRQFR